MADSLVIPFWESCPPLHLCLLGVEFKDRIVAQARKSGFERLLDSPRLGILEELPETFLILRPDVLLSDAGWRRLNGLELASDTLTLARETDSVALVRCRDADFVAGAFRESNSYDELLAALSRRLKRESVSIGEREWSAFRSESDRARVERWMLRGLIKDSEGFMSRHLERKISLAVTRRLANKRVSPNAMTFVSLAIGLFGALFLGLPKRSQHVLGSLLFWLHSVLDGCDGELARLKFAESRWGGLLDYWGDNVVHSAVFSSIAAGLYARKPGKTPPVLGFLAMGGTLLSASIVYWATMRGKVSGGPLFTSVSSRDGEVSTALEKIADQLARRDFIYLVIALAIFGKIDWFLRLGAVGAPAYFLALAALSLKNSSAARRQIAY